MLPRHLREEVIVLSCYSAAHLLGPRPRFTQRTANQSMEQSTASDICWDPHRKHYSAEVVLKQTAETIVGPASAEMVGQKKGSRAAATRQGVGHVPVVGEHVSPVCQDSLVLAEHIADQTPRGTWQARSKSSPWASRTDRSCTPTSRTWVCWVVHGIGEAEARRPRDGGSRLQSKARLGAWSPGWSGGKPGPRGRPAPGAS